MKVTVTFGQTGVVVPCKDGWTVRDLIQQATQRYRKLLEQEGEFLVRTHHVEYCDGGILDPDDILSDLVEDKDKLMAVYEEQEAQERDAANPSPTPSHDRYQAELSVFQPITGGEIEVNSSALKSNTPLLVRSSSDSALGAQSTELESSRHEEASVMAASPAVARPQVKYAFSDSLTRTVEILGGDSPLGIHVVPYCSSLSGRSLGLYIRGVEEESRSSKEGLFQEDECIVKINNTNLMDKTFSQAQEIFRQAMRSPVVSLEVLSSSNRERFEKSLIGQLFSSNAGPDSSPRVPKTKEPPPPVKAKPVFRPPESAIVRVAEDAGSLEAARSQGGSESSLSDKSPALSSLMASKKVGRRLRIDLKKGSEGLGFTVVTRDSSVHGPGPILVKNILPRGAAVKDGRLQSGDRILEVNGVDITGVGQEELVCMLRSTRHGESVCLVVLRQEDMFLPREMKDEGPRDHGLILENGKEQLMFEVPLNDSGSAGLGVSLKGNKSRETGEDLGIFIKSVIHGGAAYKDGRLHVNDQLVAVNGESLLGRSNHVAMETLRRSMSHEGNVRGTIQLVVMRALKDQHGLSSSRSLDNSPIPSRLMNQTNSPTGLVYPTNYHVNSALHTSDGSYASYSHIDDEADHNGHGTEARSSAQPFSYLHGRKMSPSQYDAKQQFQHVKASKSVDLGTAPNQTHTGTDVSHEGSQVENTAAPQTPAGLGPTLGLKKSCSLESLQTAMSEVNRKNELLPFHRPRPNMARGRGCNESFRAAIDKSYDGPPEDDDGSWGSSRYSQLILEFDGSGSPRRNPSQARKEHANATQESRNSDLNPKNYASEHSSGRETPASSSSRQGVGDPVEEKTKADKTKKVKTKMKDKNRGKGKEKEKKKAEESEETEKKSKKIGFGLLRFGKKKEDKKEAKAALQRQKTDTLNDLDFERMKDERERIEAGHEHHSKDQQVAGGGSIYENVEDDDTDPNYARIQPFKDRAVISPPLPLFQSSPQNTVQQGHTRTPPPSPQGPSTVSGQANQSYHPGAIPEDPFDRLYAKVNKPKGPGTNTTPVFASSSTDSNMDRIQQLRKEYQQAKREGMVPSYEELDPRRLGHEMDRVPGRGKDHRIAPQYDEVERQYASLPRRGPLDPAEYTAHPWSGHYMGVPQAPQGYHKAPSYPNPNMQSPPSFSNYPPSQPYSRSGDPRGVDSGFYPHPSSQQRGPLRQDVPPSPTPPLRGLRYDTMNRGTAAGGGYRHLADPSPEQYGYTSESGRQQHQHQTNPRQKNAMTAAV
ncbi:partitioning defective 3 homolog B isoform X1 [Syngnathus scovelli]|uniref:partitioning defective 3 homolog B isoform X1 n=1 Tax=Syngnathus scovelli TaxID=161590 RepID=UPI00210FAC5F|nr:partitioning defective 3 homolog B isoform X1 [Syngnathus scovelli]XP_049583326.1 partitioning defective 3 homolog B isoform X1 [Syngnathus scovelli]XP_049583327.1 partitioning defective 3 homolog B isoform X1 [Syngnathus scovelli]